MQCLMNNLPRLQHLYQFSRMKARLARPKRMTCSTCAVSSSFPGSITVFTAHYLSRDNIMFQSRSQRQHKRVHLYLLNEYDTAQGVLSLETHTQPQLRKRRWSIGDKDKARLTGNRTSVHGSSSSRKAKPSGTSDSKRKRL